MTTIRQSALEYESPQTKNIAELDKVSVDLQVSEKEATNKDGDTFKYLVTEIDGEEYRVPKTVLKQLQAYLHEKPDMEYFKVSQKGTGMNTQYTVIALE